jgi:hypothetical protein
MVRSLVSTRLFFIFLLLISFHPSAASVSMGFPLQRDTLGPDHSISPENDRSLNLRLNALAPLALTQTVSLHPAMAHCYGPWFPLAGRDCDPKDSGIKSGSVRFVFDGQTLEIYPNVDMTPNPCFYQGSVWGDPNGQMSERHSYWEYRLIGPSGQEVVHNGLDAVLTENCEFNSVGWKAFPSGQISEFPIRVQLPQSGQYHFEIKAVLCCNVWYIGGGPRYWTDWSQSDSVQLNIGHCSDGQSWNGQKCVSKTSAVYVYSVPESWQGDPANVGSSDLGASISVSYTLEGQSESPMTQKTPFNFQADIGSRITLSVISLPTESWHFEPICRWDQYGIGRHESECTLTVTVLGNDHVAAFFERGCPEGRYWTGSECACSSGQELNGQCVTLTNTCLDGQYWTGSHCACPGGWEWNGQQCVQPPQPSNECANRILSMEGGGITIFSMRPSIPFNNVQVWAFPTSFLGQDPTTQIPIEYDVGATMAVTYCQDGKSQQQNLRTPFSLWADQGTPMTLNVLSPSGFACTWDHYGYRQRQTCTLTFQVGQDDKIVAYFNTPLPDYQGGSNLVCTTEVRDESDRSPIVVSISHNLRPVVSRGVKYCASEA